MNRKRSFVSLLLASSFVVLAVSGILAFLLPFSIQIVGLHALMGFLFVAVIVFHIANNYGHLSRYSRSRILVATLGITLVSTLLFFWQPEPVKKVLGLSRNLGPAQDRFEMVEEGLVYRYSPAPHYKMALTVRAGKSFASEAPPHVAIWLENASFYHIKTLRAPENEGEGRAALPYWDFKLRGWEKAREEAEEAGKSLQEKMEEADLDAVSGATQNSSFDPADYILPADPDNPMPYRLVLEIDSPDDDLPSLVYAVEVDNADPRAFQLLELVGYPAREEEDEEGKETWALYYVDYSDEKFAPVLELVDSALLQIDRETRGE
ncbi:MAG: DUF4405 domain-containing protein [Verrucomicrobiales bacterium]|nr:DUF4405 domain-containing protein [Verrucomicrobiales bacterium]